MMFNAIFGDIAEVIMGQSPKGVDVNTDGLGLPLLNGPTEFSSRYPAPVQYTTEGRKFSEEGDILFCVRGSTTGRMNYADQSYAIGRGIAAIRGKNGYPTPYLRAVIERNLDRLLVSATGSTFPNVGRDLLLNFEVEIVSKEESLSINELLVSLEEKIEQNRQTNQTLEQIAQAIFKSWFVDFEPTRAKIAAKKRWLALNETVECSSPTCYAEEFDGANQNEKGSEKTTLEEAMSQAAMAAISGKTIEELQELGPEQQQQLRTTAELFPDALVDSELGEVPEGWEYSTLGEHFDVVMGQSPKGDTYNEEREGMLFFQGRRDFGFRYPTPRVYTTAPKRLAQAGDTLISVRAPVGDRNMAIQECCLGRGVAGIRHKSGAKSFTYAFIGHIEKNLSDSGSDGTVFSSINKNELRAVEFVAPNKYVLEYFEKQIESVDDQVEINSIEIRTLEQLRDSLLPKLLSGELKIN